MDRTARRLDCTINLPHPDDWKKIRTFYGVPKGAVSRDAAPKWRFQPENRENYSEPTYEQFVRRCRQFARQQPVRERTGGAVHTNASAYLKSKERKRHPIRAALEGFRNNVVDAVYSAVHDGFSR